MQHLLLFVVISVVIIILYFLTPVITPHYNYSATTYHDLACYMMPSYGDLTEKNYLQGTLSQIIYKPMIHYGIWIMQFYWPYCHAKGAIAAAQWINLKENLQFWLSDPLSTTVCVLKLVVMWKISCLTPFSDNQGPEISCSWKAWGFWQRSGLNLSPNVHGL